MEQFEKILIKYNCPNRTEKPKTTIEEIESIIKFKLPSDYKTYVENYLGFEGHIGKEIMRLWSIEELIQTNKEYGIIDNLPNTLGIGTNGSSEFITIILTDKINLRIILSPFIDLNEQYHIEIGTSFADFLVRLDNGQEWFQEKTNGTN